MVTAIRETVTVKAGGVVEVRSSRLHEGERAEVIVLVEQAGASTATPLPAPTWGEFAGSAGGAFKSIEEVDTYVRGLRDEWEH